MQIRVRHTPVTEKNREIVQGASEAFEYSAMLADLSHYEGLRTPWHWHEHFEFAYIVSGSMTLHTQRENIPLSAGDGYFLNANVLHYSSTDSFGEMHAQLFDKTVLSGSRQILSRYVVPIENHFKIDAIRLQSRIPEDNAMIECMEAAFREAGEDREGAELLIGGRLLDFWFHLYQRMLPVLKEGPIAESKDSIRMKQMLSYIHEHFKDKISVNDIAGAAGICGRECYRCFSNTLKVSPGEYLSRYRLYMAAQMLVETDMSIAGIALACGFSSVSYFDAQFRNLMGSLPSEYRKRKLAMS